MEDINPPKRPINVRGAKSTGYIQGEPALHMDGSRLRSAFDDGHYEKPFVMHMWQMKSLQSPSPCPSAGYDSRSGDRCPSRGQIMSDLPERVKLDTGRNNARRTFVDGSPPPHPSPKTGPDTSSWRSSLPTRYGAERSGYPRRSAQAKVPPIDFSRPVTPYIITYVNGRSCELRGSGRHVLQLQGFP